ncbi:MAG: hypothetical protein H5U40_01145 [Polyangiaceae bacterium]|nr:hypothetical protein [Polyangiaceae bacterium]
MRSGLNREPFAIRVPTLAEEVADYRGLTPEEKLLLVRAAVRTGMRLLAANENREAILEHRDEMHPTAADVLRGNRRRSA